jgi:hypothetical protein
MQKYIKICKKYVKMFMVWKGIIAKYRALAQPGNISWKLFIPLLHSSLLQKVFKKMYNFLLLKHSSLLQKVLKRVIIFCY